MLYKILALTSTYPARLTNILKLSSAAAASTVNTSFYKAAASSTLCAVTFTLQLYQPYPEANQNIQEGESLCFKWILKHSTFK